MNRARLIKIVIAAIVLATTAWAFRAYLDPAAVADFVNSRVLCE